MPLSNKQITTPARLCVRESLPMFVCVIKKGVEKCKNKGVIDSQLSFSAYRVYHCGLWPNKSVRRI